MKTKNIVLASLLVLSGFSCLTQSSALPPQTAYAQETVEASAQSASIKAPLVELPVVEPKVEVIPAPIAETPIKPNPATEPTFKPAPEAKPAPASRGALLPGETAYQWIDRMQAEYGVYAYPGTQFFVAPSTPCTFQADILGCTEQWVLLDGTITHTNIKVHITDAAVGNLYVLFHEIAHTQGIMNECEADIYSRNITGIPGGFYCS